MRLGATMTRQWMRPRFPLDRYWGTAARDNRRGAVRDREKYSVETAATTRLPLAALLSANALSLVGNQLTYIAIPWFVLQTTGSATKTGIAAFFTGIPALLAAFFGGPLVDRWGYQRTSVLADLASGVTVALIPLLFFTVGLAFWQLLALAFLGALLDSPGGAARESLLPELATLARARLELVNATSQGLWRVSGLLGPPLAGLLIAALGPSTALLFDAASFILSAAIVALFVPSSRRAAGEPLSPRAYVAELRAGLRFIRADRALLVLVLTFTILNALGEPFFGVILPVYARQILGGALDLGLVLAAFAAGGLLGTVLFGAFGDRLPRRIAYGGSLVLVAATFWPLVVLPPLAVLAGVLALRGAFAAPLNVLTVTISQERIPPGMRGRVFGVGRALALAAFPLGAALVGYLVERIGLRGTLVVIALAHLVLVARGVSSPARGLARERR